MNLKNILMCYDDFKAAYCSLKEKLLDYDYGNIIDSLHLMDERDSILLMPDYCVHYRDNYYLVAAHSVIDNWIDDLYFGFIIFEESCFNNFNYYVFMPEGWDAEQYYKVQADSYEDAQELFEDYISEHGYDVDMFTVRTGFYYSKFDLILYLWG